MEREPGRVHQESDAVTSWRDPNWLSDYSPGNPPGYGSSLVGFIDPSHTSSVTKDGSDNTSQIVCRISGDQFNAAGAARPLWVASGLGGVPVLRFAQASTQYMLDTSSAIAAAIDSGASFTGIFVGQRSAYGAAAGRAAAWSIGDASGEWVGFRWGFAGSDDRESPIYSDAAPGVMFQATAPHVVTVSYGSGTVSCYVDGQLGYQAAAAASTATSRMVLGGMTSGGVGFMTFDGDIGVWLIYASALSSVQRFAAERWARIKCGLAA
jgi:hypothetical protein